MLMYQYQRLNGHKRINDWSFLRLKETDVLCISEYNTEALKTRDFVLKRAREWNRREKPYKNEARALTDVS